MKTLQSKKKQHSNNNIVKAIVCTCLFVFVSIKSAPFFSPKIYKFESQKKQKKAKNFPLFCVCVFHSAYQT